MSDKLWPDAYMPTDEHREALAAKDAEIERLRAENQQLKAELVQWKRPACCAWCGWEVPAGLDRDQEVSAIVDHVEACEKHPVHLLLARIAELEQMLTDLRRVSVIHPFPANGED